MLAWKHSHHSMLSCRRNFPPSVKENLLMARYWKLCSLFCCLALVPGLWAAADSLPKTSANDWPQWRGPHRDGVSSDKGLLQEWPKEGPPLAWEIKGLGQGYSSVAVAGGRIFTMGTRNGGHHS